MKPERAHQRPSTHGSTARRPSEATLPRGRSRGQDLGGFRPPAARAGRPDHEGGPQPPRSDAPTQMPPPRRPPCQARGSTAAPGARGRRAARRAAQELGVLAGGGFEVEDAEVPGTVPRSLRSARAGPLGWIGRDSTGASRRWSRRSLRSTPPVLAPTGRSSTTKPGRSRRRRPAEIHVPVGARGDRWKFEWRQRSAFADPDG